MQVVSFGLCSNVLMYSMVKVILYFTVIQLRSAVHYDTILNPHSYHSQHLPNADTLPALRQ